MSKKYLSTIFGIAVTFSTALISLYSASAWGPTDRPTYTNANPADYATFNSIIDNAAVGDERNFVRIKEAGTTDTYKDSIEIVPGKEYEVYIYYHNDAAEDTNASGLGMATNTKVSSTYPASVSKGTENAVTGTITWSYITSTSPTAEAQTGKVWDEAFLTTSYDNVVLRYKTGTAIIHNVGGQANGSVLSTNLFSKDGTYIGYNKLEGKLPGCAKYSGHITYTLVADKVDVSLDKQVSTDGENWYENVSVKPGDYVTYKVAFKNTGNTNLTNAIFKDSHDEGLTLRTGSVKVFDVNNTDGKTIDDILDLSGYNAGDIAPGALVQVIYQAQASLDSSYCGKTLKNTISVKYNSSEEVTDEAGVTIECDGGPEDTPEKNCKTNPEMPECQELPNTGPLEIVMAVLIIAGIGGGGYYLYRTRKTLNKVEGAAKGGAAKTEQMKDKTSGTTGASETPESLEASKTPKDEIK